MKAHHLTEVIPFTDRLPEPGRRFVIDDKWQEYGFHYLHISDPDAPDANGDLQLVGVVEDDGDIFVLLELPPVTTIDASLRTVMVASLLGSDTIETISQEDLERVSAKCDAAAKLDKREGGETFKQVFGEFREWVAQD